MSAREPQDKPCQIKTRNSFRAMKPQTVMCYAYGFSINPSS
jgi:hypothetical protein